MNITSLDLETQIGVWARSAKALSSQTNDVLSEYFSTDASAVADALSSASTPATLSTALTKAQVQNMIGTIQQLQKFFTNQAVTTADYLNSLENVLHGSHPVSVIVSQDLENVGVVLKSMASTMIGLYADAKDMKALYDSSELGSAVTAISTQTVVFGSSSTKSKFLQGIVLVDQFSRFVGNLSVTTGDYQTSVLAWA